MTADNTRSGAHRVVLQKVISLFFADWFFESVEDFYKRFYFRAGKIASIVFTAARLWRVQEARVVKAAVWYIRMTGATAAAETTRELIIHAAADSLLENGYSGTSVRSIASKAGVAIGNLQYWFPTKSELLVEAWRYLTAKSVEELRRTLNQLTDPLEVLEVGVESLWDSLRRLGDVQLAAFDLRKLRADFILGRVESGVDHAELVGELADQ